MATQTRNDSGMVTGLFNDRDSAERAYQSLTSRGYAKDDINIVMSDEARKKHFASGTADTELGNKAAEGAGIGGALGGTLGAVLAAATAAGTSLALPGLGLVIAGPLAAAAAGAGAGAATGGLLGALVGWGIPEERVKHYESGLKQGGILMGVRPRSDQDATWLEQDWRKHNGQHIYRPGSSASSTSTGQGGAHSVVGVYDEYSDAQAAVQALVADGFQRSNIQLSNEDDTATTTNTKSTTSAKKDSGGIGGFFRSLFGSEQNPYHDTYAESARRGSHVLTVQARDDDEADRATEIMNRFDPVDVDERASYWKQQGWSGYDAKAPRYTDDEIRKERSTYQAARTGTTTTDQTRIPIVEEELKVGKREVQRGGVRVFRRMTERPVHEQVQLREEHVRVERHPVDKPATAADMAAFKEGTVELRETSEEAVVSKSARVVEEVVVGKEVSQRTQQVNDSVRKTEVDVEQIGASGTTTDDTDFRRHWQTTYGKSGGRYEDYDAAYRYGSTMAGSDQYQNYQWNDVEPRLRNDWESSHPGSTWDKVKDAVRYGAERVSGQRRH